MTNKRRRGSARAFSAKKTWFSPGFVFCVGLGLGVLIGIYAHVQYLGQAFAMHGGSRLMHGAPSDRKLSKVSPASGTKVRYDFYQLLSKVSKSNTVGATGVGAARVTKEQTTIVRQPSVHVGGYYLQVASLASKKEVDMMKAQLSLLGFDVHVDDVQVGHHDYHRLVVGPYTSLVAVYQAQKTLRKNHYNGLLRRASVTN